MNFQFLMRLLVLLLTTSVPALVKSQVPVIKGHAVGESIGTFMSNSPMLAGSLRVCRAAKDKKAAKKSHLDWNSCQRLISAVDNNGEITVGGCGDFGIDKDADPCVEFSGEALFEAGRLQTMTLRAISPWNDAYEDLIKKCGQPTGNGAELYQNLYGATFSASTAGWTRQDYTVLAIEKISTGLSLPPIRSVEITILTKDKVESMLAAAAKRKSTLD